MDSVLVSVIVTTRNEAENITHCLNSIKAQDYPRGKIEIVVVDNDSADATQEIAKKYTEKVYDYGPERSAQRNFGVKQSKGDYILYLDADMVLSREVISECVNTCVKNDFIALYIPERIVGRGFWIKVRDFERSFYNATVIDCVRFVRKGKFLEIGGFDESLTGPEDWDFDRRIRQKGNVSIINSAIYHNEGYFSLRRYVSKKAYYAQSFDAYIKKWGSGDSLVRKQLGFWYRFFLVFVEYGKWKRFLRHFILAAGVFFLKIIVGIAYLKSKKQ